MRHEWLLQLFLRVMGTTMLFALVFVFAPQSWMRTLHALADLGDMPDTPVVWYLARSASALYAMTGGLFWIVSANIGRHHLVLWYLAWSIAVLGAVLCGIDIWAAMPFPWTITEGPSVLLMAAVMIYLLSRIGHERAKSPTEMYAREP